MPQVIVDRRAAIGHAVAQAGVADVVLLAGKGPRNHTGDRGRQVRVLRCAGGRPGFECEGQGMLMTLSQAHALLPGSILVGDGTTPILRVHSDTRTLRAGDLFRRAARRAPSTHTIFWRRRVRRGRGRAGRARPGGFDCQPGPPARPVGVRQPGRAAATGQGLARAFHLARDRCGGQQRQDHGHADDRRHPAPLAGRCRAGHCRQLQQPHRRAAAGAAPDASHRVAVSSWA